MQVDIYIQERSGPRFIRIPWLPDQIKIKVGNVETATYKIIDTGDVAVPTGTGLATYSWESVWPGKDRTDTSLLRGYWRDPSTYHNILEDWMRKGTKLQVLVTGYPINKNVYLKEYDCTAAGGFGDLAYSLTLEEDRDITITSTKVQTPAPSTTKRPSATSSATSYTIKKGDTLWKISRKFYGKGSKWRTIYNANKDIIEATAKKRGRKSSSNGHWIYPGVSIKIPR